MEDAHRIPAEHLRRLQRTHPEAVVLERGLETFLLGLLHLLHVGGAGSVAPQLVEFVHRARDERIDAIRRAAELDSRRTVAGLRERIPVVDADAVGAAEFFTQRVAQVTLENVGRRSQPVHLELVQLRVGVEAENRLALRLLPLVDDFLLDLRRELQRKRAERG